jgi:hypothetical protein
MLEIKSKIVQYKDSSGKIRPMFTLFMKRNGDDDWLNCGVDSTAAFKDFDRASKTLNTMVFSLLGRLYQEETPGPVNESEGIEKF